MKGIVANPMPIIAWCLYDWAVSAFSTIILTFIFPAYFASAIAGNKIQATLEWGNAIALSGIIVAVLSPLLGAIADHEGRRKPSLAFFTLLTVGATGLLWFTEPHQNDVLWALTWVVIAEVSLEIGLVFYNALLRDLVSPSYWGRISGFGWGLGYLGGLASLCIAGFVFIKGNWLSINPNNTENIRICAPFVSLWILAFSWPLFVWTPDRLSTRIGYSRAIVEGIRSFYHTLRELMKYSNVWRFLIARMFYVDGLNTMFIFGGIYAVSLFHMNLFQVVLFGIVLNIAAGLGAISLGEVSDRLGAKRVILSALILTIISVIGLLMAKNPIAFWGFGLILGFCIGAVQAVSRAVIVKIAPETLITETFGLYALSGKATAFIGPWLVGLITHLFQSQRIGIIVVIVFLAIGAGLLSTMSLRN